LIDFTLSQLVMRVGAVLFVSTLHGCALSAAACALGDQGPRHDGRLTIDPLRQADALGGVVAVIFSVGWARWVAIDPRELRHGRIDLVLVVIAGAAALVLGAVLLRFARPLLLPLLPDTAASTAFVLVQTMIDFCLWFALFGILPVPPLAGGHLLIAVMPKLRERIPRVQLLLGLMLAVLAAAGVATRALDPVFQLLSSLVMGEVVRM
jgi:Zn-dependent protease